MQRPAAIHIKVCFGITATETKINRTQNFKSIVHSSLGSLQAFSLCKVSAVEFQLDAMELDCNSLEQDMH